MMHTEEPSVALPSAFQSESCGFAATMRMCAGIQDDCRLCMEADGEELTADTDVPLQLLSLS